MIVINAYSMLGEQNTINTAVFKYAVISSVFSAELPKDFEVKKLSAETIDQINPDPHSEICDKILFLFGAGIISEKSVKSLIQCRSEEYLNDISKAEDIIITDINNNIEDRLTYDVIEQILLCCSFSKLHSEIQTVDFDEARTLAGLPHISLVNGMAKINDIEFFKFLVNIGERFGTTSEESIRVETQKENLLNNEEVANGQINSEYYPFALDLKRIIKFSAVYDESYGKDYITFVLENSLPVDEHFADRYEEYVLKIKLHFSIKSYKKKRNICGAKINWFDYAVSNDGNISEQLKADRAKEIDLDVSGTYTKQELIDKAVKKFTANLALEDNSVIEIYYENDKSLYLYRKTELFPLDNKMFHTLLFDFNKIWGIIQMCSRDHKIKVFEDVITIPDELLDEIKPNEREYAERLIKEQYQRIKEKRASNKLIQHLSDIRAAAASDRANISAQQAAKEQQQQKIKEKQLNRKAGTEE